MVFDKDLGALGALGGEQGLYAAWLGGPGVGGRWVGGWASRREGGRTDEDVPGWVARKGWRSYGTSWMYQRCGCRVKEEEREEEETEEREEDVEERAAVTLVSLLAHSESLGEQEGKSSAVAFVGVVVVVVVAREAEAGLAGEEEEEPAPEAGLGRGLGLPTMPAAKGLRSASAMVSVRAWAQRGLGRLLLLLPSSVWVGVPGCVRRRRN